MVGKIKKLCSLAHITLNDLERACGFGKNTICKWDAHDPPARNVKKVADYFSVTLDDLIFMDEMFED